jgi:hypothetical protein
MNNSYYLEQMQKIAELAQKSSEKREFFFQQLLIVSAGTLGILLSLHAQQSEFLHIRLVFLLAVLFLLLGTLTTGIAFYDYSNLAERTRQDFHAEVEKALDEQRAVEAVFVKHKKRTKVCEKISLVSLILGLITLFIYTVFNVFS